MPVYSIVRLDLDCDEMQLSMEKAVLCRVEEGREGVQYSAYPSSAIVCHLPF